jgi:hypothetical protein
VAALKVDRHRHRSGRVGAVGIRRRFAGTITAVDHGVVTMAVRVAIAGGCPAPARTTLQRSAPRCG